MARLTNAALTARLDELSATYYALKTEHSVLNAAYIEVCNQLDALRTAPSALRRNAATLYVNGVAMCTYFTHSAAYQAMRRCKDMGMSAMYRPAH